MQEKERYRKWEWNKMRLVVTDRRTALLVAKGEDTDKQMKYVKAQYSSLRRGYRSQGRLSKGSALHSF
jgi:hypothetical protein